jgi:large subunit ribosomal protein L9
MEVILKEKVENLGSLGQVVNVKAGYARNFLLPQGKAVQATASNVETFEKQKAELEKLEQARFDGAKTQASKIEGSTITITAQAGDGGKLFGSVGTKEVAEAIASSTGVDIEKRHVRMPEGVIRQIGDYQVSIHLYTDIDAEINLAVVAE